MTDAPSPLLPTFLHRLADPAVRTVLLCGCGGGFDFVHSLLLYPELKRLGKSVVIGSYSFGDPARIEGEAELVQEEPPVKRVTAASRPDAYYGPEVHVCSYLDHVDPESAPHEVYAYYARSFTVPLLTSLYRRLVERHAVDAVVIVDGGSDSLMAGDESGLGDPIEDAVSVAAVAALTEPRVKLHLSVGLGADRRNHVSDAASLRAVAELTRRGGFLGALALEPEGQAFRFYRDCLEWIYARQSFRSVLAGAIASAVEGRYGDQDVHPHLTNRCRPGDLWVWPLMAILWAFDPEVVAARSLTVRWLRESPSPALAEVALREGRRENGIRPVEELPRHTDYAR